MKCSCTQQSFEIRARPQRTSYISLLAFFHNNTVLLYAVTAISAASTSEECAGMVPLEDRRRGKGAFFSGCTTRSTSGRGGCWSSLVEEHSGCQSCIVQVRTPLLGSHIVTVTVGSGVFIGTYCRWPLFAGTQRHLHTLDRSRRNGAPT